MRQHFGLHTDGDLVFLHQGRWGRCVTPGLENLPAPWRVRRSDHRLCPHDVTVAPGQAPAREGLVKALAPVPDGGAYVVPMAAMDRVAEALPLSNPIHPIVFPAWGGVRIDHLVPQLSLTNIAPLVIMDLRPVDLAAVQRLLRFPRVRTILFVGDVKPLNVEQIDWTLPSVPDWKRAGGALLHQHIQQLVQDAQHDYERDVGRPRVAGDAVEANDESQRG